MPRDKLNTIADGIFFSLLNYCVEVFGNVWGLQILVNKVLRSLTGLDRDTPVSVLASTSGKLSVQQRTALFTLNTVHRAVQSHEPAYSFSIFKTEDDQAEIPHHQQNCNNVNYKLSISRGGYYYRGSRLYNLIPASLCQIRNQSLFKKGAKQWVTANIPLLPP